jgi:DNA polymerase II large subunit
MAGVSSVMMMNSNAVVGCIDYAMTTTSTTGDDIMAVILLDDVLNAEFNNLLDGVQGVVLAFRQIEANVIFI